MGYLCVTVSCRLSSALARSEEHTSELQSLRHLVCRLLLEKKKRIHHVAREQTCFDAPSATTNGTETPQTPQSRALLRPIIAASDAGPVQPEESRTARGPHA